MTRVATVVVIVAAVLWTYSASSHFAFLNWDDQAVLLQNPSLEFPGVVRWAFTTTYMEHYQPLSWLVWAALKSAFGLDAAAFHAANVVAHLACVLLVFVVGRLILSRAAPDVAVRRRDAAAAAAALLYGLHPLRVEVVAWMSALPYTLALALALASLAAYLRAADSGWRRWWIAALALYAASLAARPLALGFPVALVVLDTLLFGQTARASLGKAWPFAALAALAAIVEGVARVPGLNETPWLYRLQAAASAPFVYLWHTVAPFQLTPLDVLPLAPIGRPVLMVTSLLALAAASFAAWKFRRQWPACAAAWFSYLALLVPAIGLVPSGLQVTADRYTYLPSVALAILLAGVIARWPAGRVGRVRLMSALVAVLVVASAVATRRTLAPWADSVSLWTRVVSLNPANDVGLYNLGTALAAAGRQQEAAARYREVLALQPADVEARANFDRLEAERLEQEGNEKAAQGDLAAAAERYRRAITLDPQRTHSQASRGMALASLGRVAEAIPALREATRQGVNDPAVANALGVLLLQADKHSEARRVFEDGLRAHPNDVNLAHNLARLLATTPGLTREDRTLALRLARAVVDSTGGRDARAMETLASALAANGLLTEAASTNARAAALARAQGDAELAVQITARGHSYRRPGQ